MHVHLSQKQRSLLLGFLLVQSLSAQAALVTRTTTSTIGPGLLSSVTFSFAPIADASELVSVSAGTIGGFPEFGTLDFSVLVDYTGGTTQSIYTQHISGSLLPIQQLSTLLHDLSFTTGTINGLTFQATNVVGFSIPLDIPSGTVFTFDTAPAVVGVPEPGSLALLGAAGIAAALVRRRRGACAQPATSE